MASKVTAVLGSTARRGRWRVPGRISALVVFGRCHVDYREAFVDDDVEKLRLSVLCLFGSATFIVPEGADVIPSVVSLLASTDFEVPEVELASPFPVLMIESTTLLGRCRVVTVDPDEPSADAER